MNAAAARLRQRAQNEEMVDQHFTQHGKDCLAGADALEAVVKLTDKYTLLALAKVGLNELCNVNEDDPIEKIRLQVAQIDTALRDLEKARGTLVRHLHCHYRQKRWSRLDG